MENVVSGIVKLQVESKATQESVKGLGGSISGLSFVNINALVDIADKAATSFASLADKGISFGQSIADLSSITGIAGNDLERLTANARKFGEDSGLGANTAARAYAVLASQIQVSEIGMDGLNTLQEKSITLAQASGMSLDDAAASLAGTINQFGMEASEANRVINV